jgi:hypothetical protein
MESKPKIAATTTTTSSPIDPATELNMPQGRPGQHDPVSGSVPRAGPALKTDPRIKAILAEAQAALLQGDSQKAGDLFAEATRLSTQPASPEAPSTLGE